MTKARTMGTTVTISRTNSKAEIVPVVQAYQYGKYLGYLNLTFNNDGKLLSWTGNPILLDSSVEQGKFS